MIAFTNEKVLRDVWLIKFEFGNQLFLFRPLDDGWVVADFIRFIAREIVEDIWHD